MNAASVRTARVVMVTLLAVLASGAAQACGHCVEDRIAAVYDHALSQRVAASRHQLAYFAWDGPAERSEAGRLRILALGEATAGVDHGSTRVSMEPAAIAVAFDPGRTSAAAVATALGRKLETLKLAIIPLLPARPEVGAQRLDARGIQRRQLP